MSNQKQPFIGERKQILAQVHFTLLKSKWYQSIIDGQFPCRGVESDEFPSQLVWFDGINQRGYEIDYQHIVLHGVSRDTTDFPRMHIYCQLCEVGDNEETTFGESDDRQQDASDGKDLIQVEEVRFAPKDCTHRKSYKDAIVLELENPPIL
jgi:hypothetical protein